MIFARAITAVRGVWKGVAPASTRRVYFANHTSNADFILLWAAIPAQYRHHTRPVAAADYWLKTKFRTFIGRDVVRGVLIDRNPDTRTQDPVIQMAEATDAGASLIIFSRGPAQHDGQNFAALQNRPFPSRNRAARARAGASLDRKPEPRNAQRRDHSGAVFSAPSPLGRHWYTTMIKRAFLQAGP